MRTSDTLLRGARRRQAGTMLIVVMALLAIISMLLVCNSQILFTLKQDLQRVEKLQLKKYAPASAQPAAPSTPQPRP